MKTKQSPWKDQAERDSFRKLFSVIHDNQILPRHDSVLPEDVKGLADVENHVFGELIPQAKLEEREKIKNAYIQATGIKDDIFIRSLESEANA